MTHWPHAPPHFLQEQSIYMVTAGTYQKTHFFQSQKNLKFLHDNLLSLSHLFTRQFEEHANRTFVKSVYSFDYSKVKVFDEF